MIDAKVLAHFADAIRPEVRPISDKSSRQLEDLKVQTYSNYLTALIRYNKIADENHCNPVILSNSILEYV